MYRGEITYVVNGSPCFVLKNALPPFSPSPLCNVIFKTKHTLILLDEIQFLPCTLMMSNIIRVGKVFRLVKFAPPRNTQKRLPATYNKINVVNPQGQLKVFT